MSRNGTQRASEDVAARILQSFYADDLKPGEWLGTEANLRELDIVVGLCQLLLGSVVFGLRRL